MRKYQEALREPDAPVPVRSHLGLLLILTFLVALSPWLYEAGMIVIAEWRTMTGTYTVARTPRLDMLAEWSRTANHAFRLEAASWFNRGPWRASTAVPLAIGWAVAMAVVFLNKVR